MINGLVCSGVWQLSVSQMQTMVNMNVMNDGPSKKTKGVCVLVRTTSVHKAQSTQRDDPCTCTVDLRTSDTLHIKFT